MSISLSDGTTSIELHPDLFWSDEFTWLPVEQSAERSITGAYIVSSSLRTDGRPITLQPQGDDSAWMSRLVVEQLRNWAAVPGMELELTLRGETRDVIFRHHDGPGVEASPLVHFSEMDDSDWYLTTLRFMEI